MSKTIKVDPSVRREETENKGEPLGSVPMSVTMGKPQAYKPAKEIMAAGLLSSFEAYKSYAARRKALHDTKQIVNETFEEIMKE
jgi:hypothetical protein